MRTKTKNKILRFCCSSKSIVTDATSYAALKLGQERALSLCWLLGSFLSDQNLDWWSFFFICFLKVFIIYLNIKKLALGRTVNKNCAFLNQYKQ